jgi:hypothetical protein
MILTRQLRELLMTSYRSRRRHPVSFSSKTPV